MEKRDYKMGQIIKVPTYIYKGLNKLQEEVTRESMDKKYDIPSIWEEKRPLPILCITPLAYDKSIDVAYVMENNKTIDKEYNAIADITTNGSYAHLVIDDFHIPFTTINGTLRLSFTYDNPLFLCTLNADSVRIDTDGEVSYKAMKFSIDAYKRIMMLNTFSISWINNRPLVYINNRLTMIPIMDIHGDSNNQEHIQVVRFAS
jgi:hypothetical protein